MADRTIADMPACHTAVVSLRGLCDRDVTVRQTGEQVRIHTISFSEGKLLCHVRNADRSRHWSEEARDLVVEPEPQRELF